METITVKDLVYAAGATLLCGEEDTPIHHISIDSRTMKGQDLFVPLVGERVDAHDFIGQACENGAAAVLTSRHQAMDGPIPYLRVSDTRQALQDIGRFYRKRLTLPLVGITGSVGKTTTREMVAAALSGGFQVFKTPANHNSQVGVPITLTEIKKEDGVGVIELGMSEPGELTVIAQIAQVDMAVITNIGVSHIQQLGSKENICREKLTIQDGLKPGGILFLNGDDEMLSSVRGREGFETVYYGTGEGCQFRAEQIVFRDGIPTFLAVHKDIRVPVTLGVMGLHNVQNAMVALAVAYRLGIPMEQAARSLASFTGFEGRQQIYKKDEIMVIDDTYNASPVSMKAAIQVLNSLSRPIRKIAVLADMKELGSMAGQFHYEVGTYLQSHPVDLLVTYGELAAEIGNGVKGHDPQIPTVSFTDREDLTNYLRQELRAGDAVLFKGSNSMKLGAVASCFYDK